MRDVKNTISYAVLKILEIGSISTINVACSMLAIAIPGTKRYRWDFLYDNESVGRIIVDKAKLKMSQYKKYYATLKILKEQGLVEDKRVGKNKIWQITKRGLATLRLNATDPLSLFVQKQNGVTIISYDIPESMRKERSRLRQLLRELGFKQIQKSLWFGNKKLTKQFIDMLDEREIIDFVHIFEISKTGTIEKLINATKEQEQ